MYRSSRTVERVVEAQAEVFAVFGLWNPRLVVVGLAARSRKAHWFSIAVLLGSIPFESARVLMDGGLGNLYRITLSTVGIFYLYRHLDLF